MKRLLVALMLSCAPVGIAQAQTTLRVIDTAPNDVLNVRQYPTTQSRIVGAIPPNGRGIVPTGERSGSWVFVRYGTVAGWVSARFVYPETSAAPIQPTQRAGMERCLIEVDGEAYLFGRCHVDRQPDGSMSVGTGDDDAAASPFFAYINFDGDRATGTWNETPNASHAHSELGVLRRSGGCWINERAKICAWR